MAQVRTNIPGQSGSQSLTLGASAGKAQDEELWTHGISFVAALLSTRVEWLLGHRTQDINLVYMSRGFCASGGSADTNHRACGFLRRGKAVYSRATGLRFYDRSASVDTCGCKTQRLRAGLSRLCSPATSSDPPRGRPSAMFAGTFVLTHCSCIRSIAWANGPHQRLLPSFPAKAFSQPALSAPFGELSYTTRPLVL